MGLTDLFLSLIVASSVLLSEAADGDKKKVVCYFTNWSHDRVQPYSFTPEKIDPFLCTHIIYAFADIGFRNNLIPSDPEFDFNNRAYANITALKKINKDLKLMIGIGGWQKGTLGFGRITSNDTNRREFAKNAVRFIRGYMFDGLDLNWQHPTFRDGGTPEDRENYVRLAQTLREEFEKEAIQKKKPRLLLSIAISHHEKFLPAYDIPGFNNYMDFISVIAYDYHFSYESAVNHHSPLYSLEEDNDYNYDAKININYTIHYFSELAEPEKLVLGIPTYGRTYKLENPQDTALGSYADGPGDKGPITGQKGWFAHFEICNFVKNENWTVVQTKPGSAGPYAYKGDQWVCYDDVEMIQNKAKFAIEKGLGGVMFWTIDYDDFLGKCDDVKFPLIRAARDVLDPPTLSPREPDEEPAIEGTKDSKAISDDSVDQTDIQTSDNGLRNKPMLPKVTNPSSPTSATVKSIQKPSDGNAPQPNIVGELIRLIEKAGGMTNFCNILRQDKIHKSSISYKRGFTKQGVNENSLILESPNLPPILVAISNSSVYIKEINIYNRPENV